MCGLGYRWGKVNGWQQNRTSSSYQSSNPITWTHCCIHHETLVAKRLPQYLQKILNEVVQIINYIKTRPLQSRLFSLLCKDICSEHEHLLIHTEVRWLSRGKILTRFFELKDEICVFLFDTRYAGLFKRLFMALLNFLLS